MTEQIRKKTRESTLRNSVEIHEIHRKFNRRWPIIRCYPSLTSSSSISTGWTIANVPLPTIHTATTIVREGRRWTSFSIIDSAHFPGFPSPRPDVARLLASYSDRPWTWTIASLVYSPTALAGADLSFRIPTRESMERLVFSRLVINATSSLSCW